MNKNFKHNIIKAINKGLLEALQLTLDDADMEDNNVIKVDKSFDIDKDSYQIELQIRMNKAIQNKDWKTVKELYETAGAQYTVKNKEELIQIVKDYIDFAGDECDLNWIDTCLITDMSKLFKDMKFFNRHIENWDTSNVKNMQHMFYGAQNFNQPIGKWNTSNVTDMNWMFAGAESFNQPIGNWNVSKVENMHCMFGGASCFNQPIGNWNVSNVTTMCYMFSGAESFNQPIGNWNVSNVENMSQMFDGASCFNQPIGNQDTSNVKNISWMFKKAANFNQDISGWDTSKIKIKSIYNIFRNCPIKDEYKPKFKK